MKGVNNGNVAPSGTDIQANQSTVIGSNPIEHWSKEKKLEKLANYSACQANECKCFGYKVPVHEVSKKDDLCRACSHSQSKIFSMSLVKT